MKPERNGKNDAFEWKTRVDDKLLVTTLAPVPAHEVRWLELALGAIWDIKAQQGGKDQPQPNAAVEVDNIGRLVLLLPASKVPWFAPAFPDDPNEMTWEAFVKALRSLESLEERIRKSQAVQESIHRPYPHAGIDLKTLTMMGTLQGHFLEHVAACVRPPTPGRGLLIGDPQFAAPELFDGEYPSLASDVFAAAAVFCARNTPNGTRDLPKTRRSSMLLLPKDRVTGISESIGGPQRALLLSLLDDDPQARLFVLKYILAMEPRR